MKVKPNRKKIMRPFFVFYSFTLLRPNPFFLFTHFFTFISSNTLLYMKFLILWAIVITADFMLEFRFEFLWPFWLLLRSVHDSFKYKGLVSSFQIFKIIFYEKRTNAVISIFSCLLFVNFQFKVLTYVTLYAV